MKKVIKLTESDIENIVRKVLSEQRVEDRGNPIGGGKATFNLSNTFPSGEYKLTSSPELSKVEGEIDSFLKKNPYNKIIATIKAGESKVPNPKGFEKEGSLAQARANEVIKYFSSKFPNLKFGETDVVIGTTPWDDNKGKDHPDYKKEQFFTITVDATSTPMQPNVLIVPRPTFGMSADGIVVQVGFTDGTMFTMNRNNQTENEFYKKLGNLPEFESFRINRGKLARVCNRYNSMCDNVKYDRNKYVTVDNENAFNQLANKVKSEELVFPKGLSGETLSL